MTERPVRRVKKPEKAARGTARAGLELSTADLDPALLRALRAEFTYPNPERAKKERLGLWVGNVPKTIETYEDDGDRVVFPRAAEDRVRMILRGGGFDLFLADEMVDGDEASFVPGSSAERIELREDQETIVSAIFERKTCLIRAAAGSGKSEASIAAIERIGRWALVIVWSSGLREQWVRRVAQRLGWRERDVGQIGGGKKRLAPITIAMQQSLHGMSGGELEEIQRTFGVVIADEVQRTAASTHREVIAKLPARYRIGVSADERRKDGLDCLTRDHFGEVAVEVDKDDLISRGELCEVEIVVVPTDVRIQEVEDTPRQERGQVVGRLWTRIVDVVASDEERNRAISALVSKSVSSGRSTIVFTDRVQHAHELARLVVVDHGLPCGVAIGGPENRDTLEETVKRLDSGELRVAVATSCLYQGTDVPRLEVGIVATPTAGNRQLLEQQVGRLRRKFPGKVAGRLYYLWDQNVFPGHVHNLRRWYGDRLVRIKSIEELIDRGR